MPRSAPAASLWSRRAVDLCRVATCLCRWPAQPSPPPERGWPSPFPTAAQDSAAPATA